MTFLEIQSLPKKIKIGLVALVLFLAFGVYRYYSLHQAFEATQKELVTTQAEFTRAKQEYASTTENLKNVLTLTKDQKATLESTLQVEQDRNTLFNAQIETLTGSVNTLQKLSSTDKELLQKYSKVYFLNENYIPSSLIDVSSSGFAFRKNEIMQIHSGVWPYLQNLLQTANSEAKGLQILSAFRSFGTQSTLKAGYKQTYGSGANKFSADQGYSEHQLGTAVDFTTVQDGADLDSFRDSPAYTWLLANAHKYGFVLSYPERNAYYEFEPWHWRFVGLKLAQKLHEENKHFYDLDQREIDTYLINIFD